MVKRTSKVPAKGAGKGAGTGGSKKKKSALKYTVDCTHPVEDGIMDPGNFVCVDFVKMMLLYNNVCKKSCLDYSDNNNSEFFGTPGPLFSLAFNRLGTCLHCFAAVAWMSERTSAYHMSQKVCAGLS